jgi:hypothetical protein
MPANADNRFPATPKVTLRATPVLHGPVPEAEVDPELPSIYHVPESVADDADQLIALSELPANSDSVGEIFAQVPLSFTTHAAVAEGDASRLIMARSLLFGHPDPPYQATPTR